MVLFSYSIFTKPIISQEHVNIKFRGIAFIFSLILSFFVISSIEHLVARPTAKQEIIAEPVIENPTHSISIIVNNQPKRIKYNQSLPLQLACRISKYNPEETAKRYPISIKSDQNLGVSVKAIQLGFQVSQLAEEISSVRKVNMGERITWDWIVKPESGNEGSEQYINFNVFLHDTQNKEILFEAPITTLKIEVGTPLGLPPWLLSPSIGIASIFGGLISILLPWFLKNYATLKIENKLPQKD